MTDAPTATTFNFAEAILDRSYPEISVEVYLDEASVHSLIEASRKVVELQNLIGKMKNPGIENANKLEAAQDKYDALVDKLRSERYIVKVRGIAPEESERLEALSVETFPVEYEESVSPITGATVRTEKPSDKRDTEFAMLLRQAHLVSITAPNGAVDEDFSDLEKVRTIVTRLPLVARAKVDEAINDCTIQVDFYRELVDEVF